MKTKFICDVGSNHNQNLNRTLQFISCAKYLGCWGIKFQLFEADKLYAPEHKTIINKLKKRELSRRFIPQIAAYCKDLGIKFGCTPFNVEGVTFLEEYVDFFKIGSYEILNLPLIERCAKTKKPLVISTGMSTEKEIKEALLICKGLLAITLLHCIPEYPALIEKCNLNRMEKIRVYTNHMFDVGWSDHTRKPIVIEEAIKNEASMIEFHLDLDEKGYEYEHGHCWLPEEIKPVMDDLLKRQLIYDSGVEYSYAELRKQRMDPEDSMRPLKEIRSENNESKE